MVGKATPSTWNFGSIGPRWSEIADFELTFVRSASAVTPSEKSSINTNRKSTTRFPMSLRWSSYVASKPRKGGSKPQNCFYFSKWSKSCAQTLPFEFSEKFNFWPNFKTHVAPPCGIVQTSLRCLKEHSSSKECWNPHQNWPTNDDNIAIWMTKPLFKIQRQTNKQTRHQTFVSHAAVQRRISTKLCMKI